MERAEFETLGHSVFEQVLAYVGKSNLDSAVVTAHHATNSVDVELRLSNDTWDAQSRAIDKMIEVRGLFLGEVALHYWFVSGDQHDAGSQARDFAFAMA